MATALGGIGNLVGGLFGGTGQGAIQTMAGYYPASNTVWQQWNTQYFTTNATATNSVIWGNWNQFYETAVLASQAQAPSREEVKKVEDARSKAKELLLEHLTSAQRESYEKHGMFIVEGSKKNTYRLGASNAPRKIAGEKDVVSYCIHTYGVPREDELLGFKLLLEANEDEFLRTANATALAA